MTALVLMLVQASLCPTGWEPLDTPGCFRRGVAPGVVVYLPGMMAPNEKLFVRELGFVTPAAMKADLTVIALRGAPGLCDWSPEFKTWWCWPSAKSRTSDVAEVMRRIGAALDEVAKRVDRKLPAPLVVGYSNGGYCTSMLLEAGTLPASGYAVLHAGLVTGVTVDERPRPTLLVAAEGDTIQRPTMEAFRATLEQRSWSPAFVLRKKEHPLELEDFEHVMTFARRLSWKPR